jgi:peptidoglycan/LPS O-acetylase OafA/YrhL
MRITLGEVCQGRDNNIDFLRFFLATLVIWSHSYPLLWGSNDKEPFSMATMGQTTGGTLAVDGFFILSGFLITRSWFSARGVGDYMLRRALRIYPGFLAAVMITGLIAAPLLAENAALYWQSFSWRIFISSGAKLGLNIPPTQVHPNGSLWTIRYEFLCYVAVAALGMCGFLRRRWLVAIAWLFCLGVYAMQLYGGPNMSRTGGFTNIHYFWTVVPRFASDFVAGMVFYSFRDRIVLLRDMALGSILGLVFFGCTIPFWRLFPLVVPILGGHALFYFAYVPIRRLRNFAIRGDLSYGLYLYAFPVQQLMVLSFRAWLEPFSLFILSWGATIILAVMSWHLVERPFMRLKNSSRQPSLSPELAAETVEPHELLDRREP